VTPLLQELGHSMRRDRRLIHKLLSLAYHPQKSSARRSFPQKKLNSDDHFDPQFLLMEMKGNYETRKKRSSQQQAQPPKNHISSKKYQSCHCSSHRRSLSSPR
jgi:hypothetical protein